MFGEEHSEYWNHKDPECNDTLYYENSVLKFGQSQLDFDLGQRSILHALATMSIEQMLTHENQNIQALGKLLMSKET